MQRVPQAPPDVASSRPWWHGLCALECVCVMSEAWPGLWNIIYLVAPGFTLMVCSSVAVVKITIVNWMKYHGCDVHMMLRERERVREWITQSACVRACRVWLLRDRMHVCVSEGCPLLLVTKQQHQTARTDVFPDTWQSDILCHRSDILNAAVPARSSVLSQIFNQWGSGGTGGSGGIVCEEMVGSSSYLKHLTVHFQILVSGRKVTLNISCNPQADHKIQFILLPGKRAVYINNNIKYL